MFQKVNKIISKEWEILLITIASLALRIPYLSVWLEDWDSVQFALALHNFSIVDHLPHPPGYPAYIFINRIINIMVQNDTLTLTIFSAICGSILSIPFYLIARSFMNKKIALIMTILFLSLPIVWHLSEVGLTNVPGMAFTITATYLLFKGRNNLKYLLAGSLLSGITLGIRFAEFSILLSLISLVLIHRRFSGFRFSVLFFVSGVLIWFIPLIADAGLNNFINSYITHLGYIAAHDSIKESLTITKRITSIWQLISLGFTGHFLIFITFVVIGTITLFRKILSFNFLFLGVWFFSYFVPLFFMYNIEIPRYILPLTPPFFLSVGLMIHKLKFGKFFLIPLVIIFGLIFDFSYKSVYKYKHSIPPTILPTIFVKENYSPKETTLITSFTYRQFQYYLPEYKNFWGVANAPKSISTKYLIVDYLPFKDIYPKYKVIQVKSFVENNSLDIRIPKTNLYILLFN